jgi:hypothetical protein
MHDTKTVETILSRLMPPALSADGQHEIEGMLDELAGVPAVNKRPASRRYFPLIVGGMAASIAAAVLIFQMATSPSRVIAAVDNPPGFLLVGESDRVESMTDEGWHEEKDGTTMRAMRLSVVEENSLFDEETGIVMQVTEPREELLLMPVSAF